MTSKPADYVEVGVDGFRILTVAEAAAAVPCYGLAIDRHGNIIGVVERNPLNSSSCFTVQASTITVNGFALPDVHEAEPGANSPGVTRRLIAATEANLGKYAVVGILGMGNGGDDLRHPRRRIGFDKLLDFIRRPRKMLSAFNARCGEIFKLRHAVSENGSVGVIKKFRQRDAD